MMQPDDVQEAWTALQAQLERAERFNDLVLTRSLASDAQTSLGRERRALTFEIVVNAAAIAALGSFAFDRTATAGGFSAAVVAAALIAVNAALIGIAVGLARIDFQEPVVAVQAALTRIKMQRARLTAIVLAGSPLLWPAVLTLILAIFGIDALKALGLPYLAANAAFGALLAAGVWLAARTFGERFSQTTRIAAAVDALTGNAYRDACDFLDTIDRLQSVSRERR